MDDSLQGSSVHGILQARVLEWVSLPFSRVQVLVLRCSHQPVGGQRSLEQSMRGWACLLGLSEALAPETLHPGEEAVGGGSVVQWVLQRGLGPDHLGGLCLHPRHHQGLLRVG